MAARGSGGYAPAVSGARQEGREAKMKRTPCVISVADHAGWAHAVCVAAAGGVPAVVERRRLTLIDAGLPALPYHHESSPMPEDEGNALIARGRPSISRPA